MYRYVTILLVFSLSVIYACDSGLSGELNENQPPTTSLTVNEINIDDNDQRLVSQVNISWWGDDPDGYVVGFEFFIGEGFETAPDEEWTFTTNTDSTFILPIEEGDQDADVRFTVRAVDNDDARDPTPPSLVFPITNSPPAIQFNPLQTPPDTTYRIASFGFTATDPDGDGNLNRVEVALNDTTSENAWKNIGLDFNLLTLRIKDEQDIPSADVILGRSAIDTDIEFDTVNLNGENTIYFRAIDNAAEKSNAISYSWHVKEQTSRILFLNDFEDNTESRRALHFNLLEQIGITSFDYINISDGSTPSGRRVPLSSAFPDRSLADPATNLMLAEWDYIYWISDDLFRNIGYALEMTLEFLNRGGTMFVNIPANLSSDNDAVTQFLPFLGTISVPAGESAYQLSNNSELIPIGPSPDQISVKMRGTRLGYQPIESIEDGTNLFDAPFLTRNAFGQVSEYDGPKVISAINPDNNILYFGIDFDHLQQDSDVANLLEYFVIDILDFQE